MNYRTIALPTKVADLVRSTGRSPGYWHPVHTEVATGYGPCRHCLQFFREGEDRRTLFTYDPFHGLARPLPGPVFIHAETCTRHEEAGFPSHLSDHPLSFAAYDNTGTAVQEIHLAAREPAQPTIEQLLSLPQVQYIHVRDTEAGCYDCRIER